MYIIQKQESPYFRMSFLSDLDWIQTSNLLSRNQMRYSVAPRGLNTSLSIYFYRCSVNLFAGANICNNA
jgi:hypothetical protein